MSDVPIVWRLLLLGHEGRGFLNDRRCHIDVSGNVTITYRTGNTTINSLQTNNPIEISGGSFGVTTTFDSTKNITLGSDALRTRIEEESKAPGTE